MKFIEVDINEDGSRVTQDAKGFTGHGCMKLADAVKVLGGEVTEKKKAEYHRTNGKLSTGNVKAKA